MDEAQKHMLTEARHQRPVLQFRLCDFLAK